MPSARPRISVTITEPLQRALETLWTHYPNLQGSLLESIQWLMIYGAKALDRDEKLLDRDLPKGATAAPTGDVAPLPKQPEPEQKAPAIDDEWA